MKRLQQSGHGDFYIKLKVMLPEKLSRRAKDLKQLKMNYIG
jgi:DnaJ-class molecular chaperone